MKKYTINFPVIVSVNVEVIADSEEEALEEAVDSLTLSALCDGGICAESNSGNVEIIEIEPSGLFEDPSITQTVA